MANSPSPLRALVPILILGGVVVVGAGLFGVGPTAGWLGSIGSDDEADAIAGPKVKRGPLVISVTQRGELSAKNAEQIRNELEGRTTILSLVPEGTRVEAGEVVAELDVSSTEDRRVQQEISVQNSEAAWIKAKQDYEIQVSQNLSDIERAKRVQRFAEKDLEKYLEGDYPQQLAKAAEDITLAKEELKQAQERLDDSQKLLDEGFLTRTEYDTDRLSEQRRDLSLKQAERAEVLLREYDHPKQLETLRADIEEAQRELDRTELQAQARLVDFEARVASAEAQLDLERSDLRKITDQIAKARVRAPIAGLVVYGRQESRWGQGDPIAEGTEVRERQELITIPREGGMIVEASLHESVIKKVEKNQECIIKVDAIPGSSFEGIVEFVSILPDSNSFWANPNQRLFKTQISVKNPIPDMRPGMSCEVEILVDSLEDVLQVPVQAVFRTGSRTICFVDEANGVEQVDVEVGRDNDRWVEVTSGLAQGQTVLLAPPAGFKLEPVIQAPAADPSPGEAAGGDANSGGRPSDRSERSGGAGGSGQGKPSGRPTGRQD